MTKHRTARERLKALRESHHLSQKALAEMLSEPGKACTVHVPQSMVCQLERGSLAIPSLAVAYRIDEVARKLGSTMLRPASWLKTERKSNR